jgi:RND family efflux transporter MFP subunit
MKINKGLIKGLTKKRIILIIVVLIVVAIGIFRIVQAFAPETTTAKTPVNVTVATAEIGTVYATSPLTGKIDPVESATIVPMAAGQVTAVDVEIGDYVHKGTLLFKTDPTQASVIYNQAKIARNTAKADFDRVASLYNEGAVSLQSYQNAQAQYSATAQSLTAAAAALGYCTVTAPISGYVTSVNVTVGQLASQASPAVTIADVSSLKINTTLSEYLVGKVKVGDSVDIYIKTLSKTPFKGTITALSPAPAAGTLTYPVTISVEDPAGVVKAGMFAEIQIVSAKKDNVLCIPSDAVFLKSGESKVTVLKGKIPKLVTVTTGLDNGVTVEITSGLKAGDTIVVTGQQYVTEGEAVKVME